MAERGDDPALEAALRVLRERQRTGALELSEIEARLREMDRAAFAPAPASGIEPEEATSFVENARPNEPVLANIGAYGLEKLSNDPQSSDGFWYEGVARELMDRDYFTLEEAVRVIEAAEVAQEIELQRLEKAWAQEMEPIVANARKADAAATAALDPGSSLDNRKEALGRANEYGEVMGAQMLTAMKETRPAMLEETMSRMRMIRGGAPAEEMERRVTALMQPSAEITQATRRMGDAQAVVSYNERHRQRDQRYETAHDQRYQPGF